MRSLWTFGSAGVRVGLYKDLMRRPSPSPSLKADEREECLGGGGPLDFRIVQEKIALSKKKKKKISLARGSEGRRRDGEFPGKQSFSMFTWKRDDDDVYVSRGLS